MAWAAEGSSWGLLSGASRRCTEPPPWSNACASLRLGSEVPLCWARPSGSCSRRLSRSGPLRVLSGRSSAAFWSDWEGWRAVTQPPSHPPFRPRPSWPPGLAARAGQQRWSYEFNDLPALPARRGAACVSASALKPRAQGVRRQPEDLSVKASVFVGTSLDGFIARVDGQLDFLPPGGGEPHGYDEFIATVDALVIGRNTFDTVLAFKAWPYGEKPVFVLSSRPLPPTPPGAILEQLSGDPAAITAQLEDRSGRGWR